MGEEGPVLSVGVITNDLLWLALKIVFLVVVAARGRGSAWGQLAITGLSLWIAASIVGETRGILLAALEARSSDWPFRLAGQVNGVGSILGTVLLLLAIASAPSRRERRPVGPPLDRSAVDLARPRRIALVVLWTIVTLGAYWLYWLFTTVRELRAAGARRITFAPGWAIGFLFIPVFNVYWLINVVVRVSGAIAEVDERSGSGPEAQDDSRYSAAAAVSVMLLALLLTSVVSPAFQVELVLAESDASRISYLWMLATIPLVANAMIAIWLAYGQLALNRVWRRFQLADASG